MSENEDPNATNAPTNTTPPSNVASLDDARRTSAAGAQSRMGGGEQDAARLEDQMSEHDNIEMRHYALVVAVITFRVGDKVRMEPAQFFSDADIEQFPAPRLNQMQQTAAAYVKNRQAPEDQDGFEVLSITFQLVRPLGWMTRAQFFGSVPVPAVPVPPTA